MASKYGGIPIEDETITESRFGGIPVDEVETMQKPVHPPFQGPTAREAAMQMQADKREMEQITPASIDMPTTAGMSQLQQLPIDVGKGVGETALTMATGAAALPISGLAGIAAATGKKAYELMGMEDIAKDIDTSKLIGDIQRMMTYQPKTEQGKALQYSLGKLVEPLTETMQKTEKGLGEIGYELAGPVGGTIGATLPTAIIEIASYYGTKGLRGEMAASARKEATSAIKEKIGKAAKEEIFDESGVLRQEVKQSLDQAGIKPEEVIETGQIKVPTEAEYENIGRLVREASSDSMGAQNAKEQLAKISRINPEAKATAEKMGFDLPADVFSDSPAIREAAGITRSVAGTPASGYWREVTIKAADKADELMKTIDASANLAQVSDNVKAALKKQQQTLENSGSKIYKKVNEQVPKNTEMDLTNLETHLEDVLSDLGGDPKGFTSKERQLYSMVKNIKGTADKPGKPVTYFRLLREKDMIGKALEGFDNIYAKTMDSASLKKLYAALAEDQLASVDAINPNLGKQLRAANLLWGKKKTLEDRIISAFGKNTDGSISSLMSRAIKGAQKGDIKDLNKILEYVPKNLQKEAVATALMANTRSKSGQSIVKGGFGFSEYADMYRGLKQNTPIFNKITNILGKDSKQFLDDMYMVSKRMTDARANVMTTGKSNQTLLQEMMRTTNGFMDTIIEQVGGRGAELAGKVTGAPGTGRAISKALKTKKTDPLQAAGKMFASPEFQNLMTTMTNKLAIGQDVPYKYFKRVLQSKAFNRFADTIKLPRKLKTREAWLMQQYNLNKEQAKQTQEEQ